jgi:hypothetical protein
MRLGAAKVRIFDGKTQVATHERVISRSGQPLILDTLGGVAAQTRPKSATPRG